MTDRAESNKKSHDIHHALKKYNILVNEIRHNVNVNSFHLNIF